MNNLHDFLRNYTKYHADVHELMPIPQIYNNYYKS